jgi:hypothetical protein
MARGEPMNWADEGAGLALEPSDLAKPGPQDIGLAAMGALRHA